MESTYILNDHLNFNKNGNLFHKLTTNLNSITFV